MTVSTRNKIAVIFSVILFAALWELTAIKADNSLIFPSIEQIAVRLFQLGQTKAFWTAVFVSLGRVILAFSITFVLGLTLGFATGFSQTIRSFLTFPFAIIRSTPVVALIMVMLFWFDSSVLPVVSGVLMSLPVITDVIGRAVESTDSKLLQMAKVYGFSPWMKFRYIYFNQARPYIRQSASTVFAMSFKVVAAGEILSLPRNALGTMIQDNRQVFESASVLALTVVLVLLSIVSSRLFFICYKGVSRLAAGPVLPQLGNPRPSTAFQAGKATAPAPDAKVSIKNLTFGYSPDKLLFKDFNLEIEPYTITTITAPTGRGKTTLLNILAGLITDFQGTVKCPEVSYIFQESGFLPCTTVIDNVAIPLMTFMDKKTAYEKACDFLNRVNMQDYMALSPDVLSGGQKQLVSIARAFAFERHVILMDEATSSLDKNSREKVWTTIQELLKTTPSTVINVSHDAVNAGKVIQLG